MALSKRHLVLAATATTLGLGGVLLPGASAMAATTPEQSVAVAAPESQSATTTTESVDIAIFDESPVPNQMIMIGARAMIGIDPSAMMNGCITRAMKREYQSDRPSTVCGGM